MGRLLRRLRAGGQDVPPLNLQTMEYLQWGGNLITFPTPFPAGLAAAAWEAHRFHVMDDWASFWVAHEVLPICWAQRKFDRTPQISTVGLPSHVRNMILSVEATVA